MTVIYNNLNASKQKETPPPQSICGREEIKVNYISIPHLLLMWSTNDNDLWLHAYFVIYRVAGLPRTNLFLQLHAFLLRQLDGKV